MAVAPLTAGAGADPPTGLPAGRRIPNGVAPGGHRVERDADGRTR